jgi:hypothetical protein
LNFFALEQKKTARVYQASPLGLDFQWMGGESDEGAGQVSNVVPERLFPATEGRMGRDEPLWCGKLSMFDSECEACFQRKRLMLRVSSAHANNQPKGAGLPSVFFWQINTWGCEVGEALAPGMDKPSENHGRRSAEAKDGVTDGEASGNVLASKIHPPTRKVSRRFNVIDMPPNNADWLLFSSASINIHDHYTQGETADGSYCVFDLSETVSLP